ncbi:MAG: hypothetical protein K0S75_2377, partial [Clostridia bacterium]|nr:hypothetical protein [Clostridia bacterium]
ASKGSKASSIFSKISGSEIFQNGKDAIVNWIKSTDQYAAMQENLKAMMSEWLSTDSGTQAVNAISNALSVMAGFIEKIAAIALSLGTYIVDNWGWISPLVWGIVFSLIAYNAVMGISNFLNNVHKDGLIKAAAAQLGLNTAMQMSPIAWIIIAIIALIAIIYAVVGAINKFAGTSISATGIIAGAFMGLGAMIYNVVATIWNNWTAFIEFFANAFNDPVYSVKRLFVNLASNILGLVKSIASAIDTAFGSNLSGSVTNLNNQMQDWLAEKPENYKVIKKMEMLSVEDSAKAGYDWGKGVSEKFDLKKVMNLDINDFTDQSIKDNTANTAANTARTANSLDMSSENLEYMRDIAEQEVVNRFTTAEIKVDMANHMAVNNEMDLDGVVTYLGEKLNQEMETVAEGVHI